LEQIDFTGYYETMNLSVIMATYNRRDSLEKSLNRLQQLNYSDEKHEIIIVNDGSVDGTKEFLNQKEKEIENLQVFHNKKNKGIGATRNKAIKHARGEYIFCTDDDSLVPEDWIQQHFKRHEKENVDVVDGIAYPTEINYIEAYKIASHWEDYRESRLLDTYHTKEVMKTGNLSLKKEILDDVGYFNEELARGEDTELGKRILKNGYTILKDPELRVEHLRVDTLTDLLKTQYNLGKSLQLLNQLHEPVEIERTSDKNYLLEAWKEYYRYVGLTKFWIFPIIAFASTTTRRLSQREII